MTAFPGPTLDFRNTNTLWCSVLVETLVRCGARHAVISPGSRSTALTMALVQHPQIETVPVLDERSAAFFALGLAKQHHRPTVLVCTSGTAGANYFPAIIEARESGTPLLVITADRPPEMRECASGQTVDQQKLFGAHVNWYHELAVPEPNLERLRYLRQTVAHAYAWTVAPGGAGPVHLNAPFRDPLPPIDDESTGEVDGTLSEAFFAHLSRTQPVAEGLRWSPPATARGLIVAGPDMPVDADVYADHVTGLARHLGWPILADALSPLRHYAEEGDPPVTAYDAVLRDEEAARALKPEFVLCLGGWPTSKILRTWLEQSEAEITLVSRGVINRDALHGRTRQLTVAVELLTLSGTPGTGSRFGLYAQLWRQAETAARGVIDAALTAENALFEPKAAWLLGRHLPTDTPVFVASSMPVRDVEYVWPPNARWFQFFFNRGANGIDGTLSTALGVAHGNLPTVLLAGDLSLLHDTNGFLLRPKLRGSLTIVLINNRGGGIFQHLPVAQFDPPFEEYFATPQEVDFVQLCLAYDVDHVFVRDWPHFVSLISELPAAGVRVLEIATDRTRDAPCRKKLFGEAAAGAGEIF